MSKDKEFVGIDISMNHFDVCYSNNNHAKFTNDKEGFKLFLKTLSHNSVCVMEQTGRYHQSLAFFLKKNEVSVCVENALVIKRYVQMRLKSVKTDKADAKMIRDYARHYEPKEWNAPTDNQMQCMELRALSNQLKKQSTALRNILHSMKSSNSASQLAKEIIEEQLKSINVQIKRIDTQMELLLKQHEGTLLSLLCSIPGMGKKTAMSLIISTNGFRNFENSKQLSSFFGLSPTIRQSGSSIRGRSKISKAGNKEIRSLLFMCSLSACNCNKSCNALFERITNKGKSKQLALMAVCNKLLKQAFAIAKNRIPYDEFFVSVKKV